MHKDHGKTCGVHASINYMFAQMIHVDHLPLSPTMEKHRIPFQMMVLKEQLTALSQHFPI